MFSADNMPGIYCMLLFYIGLLHFYSSCFYSSFHYVFGLRSVSTLISCCGVQMLYETSSSCLVGKVDKKGRPYKNVTCQCSKTTLRPMCSAEFPDLLYYKYQRALVPPGEAVGMLAAQVGFLCGFILIVATAATNCYYCF